MPRVRRAKGCGRLPSSRVTPQTGGTVDANPKNVDVRHHNGREALRARRSFASKSRVRSLCPGSSGQNAVDSAVLQPSRRVSCRCGQKPCRRCPSTDKERQRSKHDGQGSTSREARGVSDAELACQSPRPSGSALRHHDAPSLVSPKLEQVNTFSHLCRAKSARNCTGPEEEIHNVSDDE